MDAIALKAVLHSVCVYGFIHLHGNIYRSVINSVQ